MASFRVDRLRAAVLLPTEEYEVPDDFTAEAFRRDDLYTPRPGDLAVKVRFSAAAAGRVREETAKKFLQERPDGQVVKTYKIAPGRPRWLYTHVARYGPHAEILSPPEIRRGMAAFLDALLGDGEAEAGPRSRPAGAGGPSRVRKAAAVSRPKRPRTKRKPRG